MWRFTDEEVVDEELKELHEEVEQFCRTRGVCPIFLLCDYEERTCEITNCRHHLFYDEYWDRNDTEHSRLIRNCVTYGASNVDEMTLEEIAAMWNLSRERVRQIIEKALYGQKKLGKQIMNTPRLRDAFHIGRKEIAIFSRGADLFRAKEKAKNAHTLKCRAEERRIKWLTKRSRTTSGRTQRLNP